MKQRYEIAWRTVLNGLTLEKQNHIRKELEVHGKLQDSEISNDLVKRICSLAESDAHLS